MQTVHTKTILSRNKNTWWFGSEYNMNLYRGCCHGCLYCDSRSSCYRVDNFDTVRIKENALELLRNELAKKQKTGMIATGAMSDPYNPFEIQQKASRNAAELINAYDFGLAIATKSDLITRDIDVFKSIKEHSPMLCKITITCADDALAAKIEPRVSLPSKRFEALRTLSKNGIYCGVLMMPILPFIQDNPENIIDIVNKSAEAGARFIYPFPGVTLRDGQREYFYAHLDKAFPGEGLAAKYAARFGSKYQCYSPKTKRLMEVFYEACNKHGLLHKMQDIISGYKQGYGSGQLSFW